MKQLLHIVLAAAALSLGAAAQASTLGNGSFAGLTGWSSLGDVSTRDARAWLTTASVDYEDDYPASAGAFNLSGQSAAAVGTAQGVEVFAGLQPGALDPQPLDGIAAYEGSVLRQNFYAAAGETLSFNWQLFSNELPLSGADYAFVLIDGQRFDLATAADAGASSGTLSFAQQTNLNIFSHIFGQSGLHTLVFGVVDVLDYNATSALAIGNVAIAPVPEPGQFALLLSGLGLMGVVLRRRKSS